MGIIKNSPSITNTYKLTLDIVKDLIAKDLDIPIDEISVNYIISNTAPDYPGRYPDYNVISVDVTHKPK